MLPIKIWNSDSSVKISIFVDEDGIDIEEILLKGKSVVNIFIKCCDV